MGGDGKGTVCGEVAAVAEAGQGLREEDEEDCFFVNVPAEEEGGVGG